MRRFWFVFELTTELPMGVAYGCGVTAQDYDDAVELVRTQVFGDVGMPDPLRIITDVDPSLLDQRHVQPNMGNIFVRGVWFPRGYD